MIYLLDINFCLRCLLPAHVFWPDDISLLVFWSGAWTLVAWCETRNDRIEGTQTTARTFTQKRGRRLEDFLGKVRAEAKH